VTAYWTGRQRSPETKAKISATKRGKPNPHISVLARLKGDENMRKASLARRRALVCMNDGLRFVSAVEAASHYGLPRYRNIHSAIYYGYAIRGLHFRYGDR